MTEPELEAFRGSPFETQKRLLQEMEALRQQVAEAVATAQAVAQSSPAEEPPP